MIQSGIETFGSSSFCSLKASSNIVVFIVLLFPKKGQAQGLTTGKILCRGINSESQEKRFLLFVLQSTK